MLACVLYLLLFRMYCDLFCLLWCSLLLRGTCHLGGSSYIARNSGLFTIIGHGSRNKDQVSALHKYDESGDSNKSSVLVPTTTTYLSYYGS